MEINELKKISVETAKQRLNKLGVEYNEESYMLHLMEEIGELSKQFVNKKLKRKEIDIKNIGEEIADCMILLMNLGACYNINIEKSILDKIEEIKNKVK